MLIERAFGHLYFLINNVDDMTHLDKSNEYFNIMNMNKKYCESRKKK